MGGNTQSGKTANLAASESVCVAICTFDRLKGLARALDSVRLQTLKPNRILVIDNNPANPATASLIDERYPDVSLIRETIPGVGAARRRAMQEAKEAIVAFLDDDAVAEPGWLAALCSGLAKLPRPGACTGRTKPLCLETPAQELFEANGGYDRGTAPMTLQAAGTMPLGGFPAPLIARAVSMGNSCNLALYRTAVADVGGFDAFFGGAATVPGGEDLDLFWRLVNKGHGIVYEPRAVVLHEHRRSMTELAVQLSNQQRSLVSVLSKALVSSRWVYSPGIALFLVWRLGKPALRMLRRLTGKDPLPLRILAAMWWAAMSAPLGYVVSRSRPRRDLHACKATGKQGR